MDNMKNARGYSLFLTVFVIVIFSILAVSLLTVVISGTKKTAVRDEVTQATELSNKGLDLILNQINHDLQQNIPEKGVSETEFRVIFDSVLKNYQCPASTTADYPVQGKGETGLYKSCVVDEKYESPTSLIKEVIIESTGFADDNERTIETTVLIGADGYPVPLKYVLSTNASKECAEKESKCQNGEGNLYLHGSSTIVGDMKVDRDLIVSDMAYTPARAQDYVFKEVYWLESLLPDAKDSEIELGGSIYRYHLPQYLKKHSVSQSKYREKINAYINHINLNDFTFSEYEELFHIEEAFHEFVPELGEKQYFQDDIEITNHVEEFKYNNNDDGVVEINSAEFKLFEGHRTFKNLNNNHQLYGFYCAKGLLLDCFLNLNKKYTGKFYLVGNNNNIHKFAVRQDLHIGRELTDIFNETIKININDRNGEQGGIYVGRDLTIGRGITTNLEASITDPNLKVEIDGNIFVNGDLTITGVDGKFNSIMYVNGDVTIDRSKFSGLKKDGKTGSLIIFANGKINIVKNSLFRNEPDVLKGFFYSKKGIEIYGSASNLVIEGGLSAPRIALNSIRGRAGIGGFLGVIKPFSPAQHYVFGYYDTKDNQIGKPSRLQLKYDEDILNTYSDLSVDDYIYNVVQPTIIKREEK